MRLTPAGLVTAQAALGIAALGMPLLRTGSYKSVLLLGLLDSLVFPLLWMGRADAFRRITPPERAAWFLGLGLLPAVLLLAGSSVTTRRYEVGSGLAS